MKRLFLIVTLFLAVAAPLYYLVPHVFAYTETEMDKKGVFKVVSVTDGDTIKVSIRGKVETVRLLGIDTPETVDPRKPVQCFGKAASDKMKSFVNGKYVRLVNDKSQGDRDIYKRLLRYVYLADSKATFINGEMVKQGYAFSYRQYPTIFLNKFNAWEKYAREHNLGLWNSCPLVSPTKVPTRVQTRIYIKPTIQPQEVQQQIILPIAQEQVQAAVQQNNGGFSCDCSRTCTVISSCAEAQYQLNSCGCSVRDNDHDGIACDGAPLKCQN
jgi:endonuclease YncB( thermonuclease family)